MLRHARPSRARASRRCRWASSTRPSARRSFGTMCTTDRRQARRSAVVCLRGSAHDRAAAQADRLQLETLGAVPVALPAPFKGERSGGLRTSIACACVSRRHTRTRTRTRTGRPRLGCRLALHKFVGRFVPAICTEIADWKSSTRVSSLCLLRTLLVSQRAPHSPSPAGWLTLCARPPVRSGRCLARRVLRSTPHSCCPPSCA